MGAGFIYTLDIHNNKTADIYQMEEKDISLFKNKTLMITGGTGSFGNAVLNRFLTTDIGEIRIFSCDEKKQDDTRRLCPRWR